MDSCFGCGNPTSEYETVYLKKKLNSYEEDHLFHTTKTINYDTTSLRVPFCKECHKRSNSYLTILNFCFWLTIGAIYYIWHLYFPNFFKINGFFKPLGVFIAYIAVIGGFIAIYHKIASSITGHKKNPNNHPEIKKLIARGWKEGRVF